MYNDTSTTWKNPLCGFSKIRSPPEFIELCALVSIIVLKKT